MSPLWRSADRPGPVGIAFGAATTTTTSGGGTPPSPPGPSTSGPGLPMPGSVWGSWGSRPPPRHSYPKPRTRTPLTDQRSVWYLNPLPPLSRKGVQISHGRGFKSPNRLKPANPLPAHSRSPFRAATQPPQVAPSRPCTPYLHRHQTRSPSRSFLGLCTPAL